MTERTLLLLRHAKSDWKSGSSADHDRTLNERGERAAMLMGAYLAQKKLVPDVIVASSATRAQDTVTRLLTALGDGAKDVTVAVERKLYMAAPKPCLAVIRAQDADVRTLMLVAHNPGLQELAVMLAENGDATAGSAVKDSFPTCALAVYRHKGGWANVEPSNMELVDYTFPKALV